jgi:hypothetical protein
VLKPGVQVIVIWICISNLWVEDHGTKNGPQHLENKKLNIFSLSKKADFFGIVDK